MLCSHLEKCHDCVEGVSFDELKCGCGRKVIYPPIPCGTAPPLCNFPCSKTRECGHGNPTPHYCHPEGTDCPPCMVFTTVPCACGKSMIKTVPCSRKAIPSCSTPCGQIIPQCGHSCSRVCHASDCQDETHPCVAFCNQVRSCGHVCRYKCHNLLNQCDESQPCKFEARLLCDCGNLSQIVQCGSFLNAPSKCNGTLQCDASCALKKRKEAMTIAFKIDTSIPSPLNSFTGWKQSLVALAVPYLSVVVEAEKVLSRLVSNTQEKYFYFPVQKTSKCNSIICEMCVAYGFVGEIVDQRVGKGTVIARRQVGQSPSIPKHLLSSLVKTYNPINPDPLIVRDYPDEMYAVKTWTPNGLFIGGLVDGIIESGQEYLDIISSIIKPFVKGAKLFWLNDIELFLMWTEVVGDNIAPLSNVSTCPPGLENLRVESIPIDDVRVQDAKELKDDPEVQNDQKSQDVQDSAQDHVEEKVELEKVVGESDQDRLEKLVAQIQEKMNVMGWLEADQSNLCLVLVSPLGTLTNQNGLILGRAKDRKVKKEMQSEWKSKKTWKGHLIDLD